jgi:hypothetical protein
MTKGGLGGVAMEIGSNPRFAGKAIRGPSIRYWRRTAAHGIRPAAAWLSETVWLWETGLLEAILW